MIPWRLLFLLTALVLALHALLLSGASASDRRAAASAPPVFETRTIRAPVAAKAPTAPVVSAKPKRAKPAAAAPTKARTVASPAGSAQGEQATAPPALASPPWIAPSQSELLALDASGENQAAGLAPAVPQAPAQPTEAPVRAASTPAQEPLPT
ncbi:MAG: hypothetical protein ACTS6O_07845, partial [Giesbergeria sp.]